MIEIIIFIVIVFLIQFLRTYLYLEYSNYDYKRAKRALWITNYTIRPIAELFLKLQLKTKNKYFIWMIILFEFIFLLLHWLIAPIITFIGLAAGGDGGYNKLNSKKNNKTKD